MDSVEICIILLIRSQLKPLSHSLYEALVLLKFQSTYDSPRDLVKM